MCAVAVAGVAGGLAGCGGGGVTSNSSTTLNPESGVTTAGKFVQTNLVADAAGAGAVTVDTNLKNPWSLAFTSNGPFWVANNGTGTATVYDDKGTNYGLVVNIPSSTGGPEGPVTGEVYNNTKVFVVSGYVPGFIFCSSDGTISAWNGNATSWIGAAMTNTMVNRSKQNASYKGLAIGAYNGSYYLYATNFNSGQIDIFNSAYKYVTSFTDKTVPAGYVPFGIKNIGNYLYVTFTKQSGVAGAGFGYVDKFNTAGTLLARMVSNGVLNQPWGMEVAPAKFGNVGGDLLVGNFGDGKINAFGLTTRHWDGALLNSSGAPLVIPGLWALAAGNGVTGSASDVYFTSGPGNQVHGLFGQIANAP
ncbi:MAG TPA: TIGR03118 family protein [Fimbriimonadaceae bacterium]|jgi:uncharacterized protein (TIGR03118 family)